MTEGARVLPCSRRALLLAGLAAAAAPVAAQQRTFALGMLSQSDDERYTPQALQNGFPDAPAGRSAPAAEIALNDGLVNLQMAAWTSTQPSPWWPVNSCCPGRPAATRRASRGLPVGVRP